MTVWVGCGGCHTEIATAFSKPRNDKLTITRLALLLQSLVMTVWVGCGGCYTEIATNCKSNSRNGSSFFVITRSEATKQSTTTNNKHKNKKEKEIIVLCPLRHCETS